MNTKKDRRKIKRLVNYLRRTAGYGKYVLDCRNHPCIVTAVEFYTNDLYGNGIDVKSLLNGIPFSCSLLHCGIRPINKVEADSMVAVFNARGWDSYLVECLGYGRDDLVAFHELDEVWDFDKGAAK